MLNGNILFIDTTSIIQLYNTKKYNNVCLKNKVGNN